ncbi:transglycosylase domain-containing protein [Staphylococcus canis]|uniref:Penicillin-binding protein n=1 Tax=Staphylococcus canis TaxID=2724942 RepID=A0ABS0T6R4_9STAP|nr:transglycosylase domain-containing protein [Staphylococcus canis]MBI5974255.1 penicillin-binding protein [Staphylococcus canis]
MNHHYQRLIYKLDYYFTLIKKVILSFFIFIFLATFFLIGVCFGYFASIISKESNINDQALSHDVVQMPELNTIELDNQNLIHILNQPEPLSLAGPAEVNPYVSEAVIASEDAQFYEHNGILPKAILRAIYQDILDHHSATGGSTITQQLVKNQLLTQDKTYQRKAKEIMYALRIEKLFTKTEIIYIYLNIVPFGYDLHGQHITGITSASYGIFGKSPSQLNLAESSYLAGLLQSPYYYTPFTNEGQLRSYEEVLPSIYRQRYVLKRMYIENQISYQQYQNARKQNIYERILTQ